MHELLTSSFSVNFLFLMSNGMCQGCKQGGLVCRQIPGKSLHGSEETDYWFLYSGKSGSYMCTAIGLSIAKHRENCLLLELMYHQLTKVYSLFLYMQGMAYLHDRGITHPLLTSKSIHIHYRACISMLSTASCSK